MATPILNPSRRHGVIGVIRNGDLRNQDGVIAKRSKDHLIDFVFV